ncbi:RNA-binding cell elongation regulator Jag/EloR [Lentilactobacillus hilgardii]|uniref:RNA-binding cell elongation regulator Jag/EloR n=1 Tax=Lentilactobacillus hilgardii TaxID=1588 RepID=UPI00019C4A2D|nr:RNA-binding cell elongation regulator Jag/EloR [Lentilactobacillus hilgardii]EEI72417.1 R3H domain protein [Lentilactobacillus hilgardii ATCC 27305]
MIIYSGKTIQDAVKQGLAELSLNKDQVEVKVIQQPRNGFFGIGRKQAKIELLRKENTNQTQIKTALNNQPHTESSNNQGIVNPSEIVKEARSEDDLDLDKIAQDLADYLNDVLEAMGFSFTLKLDLKNKHSVYIDIDTEQESRLIGRHGRTINALQNLAQIFVNRSGANNVTVELDTADYRNRRSEALIQLADKTARNAIANGKPVYLNPMPSFERKQIHNALADNDHVITYSTGKEPHRVIVVAPK